MRAVDVQKVDRTGLELFQRRVEGHPQVTGARIGAARMFRQELGKDILAIRACVDVTGPAVDGPKLLYFGQPPRGLEKREEAVTAIAAQFHHATRARGAHHPGSKGHQPLPSHLGRAIIRKELKALPIGKEHVLGLLRLARRSGRMRLRF